MAYIATRDILECACLDHYFYYCAFYERSFLLNFLIHQNNFGHASAHGLKLFFLQNPFNGVY